jgi:hypothetical protein
MKLFWKAFKRTLGQAVGAMIPLHYKRILFLMTLYKLLRGLDTFDLQELEELNQRLKLAGTGARGLVLPGEIGSLVWGVKEQPTEQNLELSINEILRRSPCWLIYGRKEDIEKDCVVLREFVNTHTHA